MAKKKKSSWKTVWWISGAATIVTMLIVFWPWHAPETQVPEDLIGEWHTADPDYADRWFEISPIAINFVTGEGQVSTGFINEIKVAVEDDKTLYTISYSLDGTPNQVAFYYEFGQEKTIRFKHQERTVWIKDKAAS